eukprot:1189469-Amphidinium_carterae.1
MAKSKALDCHLYRTITDEETLESVTLSPLLTLRVWTRFCPIVLNIIDQLFKSYLLHVIVMFVEVVQSSNWRQK